MRRTLTVAGTFAFPSAGALVRVPCAVLGLTLYLDASGVLVYCALIGQLALAGCPKYNNRSSGLCPGRSQSTGHCLNGLRPRFIALRSVYYLRVVMARQYAASSPYKPLLCSAT